MPEEIDYETSEKEAASFNVCQHIAVVITPILLEEAGKILKKKPKSLLLCRKQQRSAVNSGRDVIGADVLV